MNGLIPALVAVLLAELGERAVFLSTARQRGLLAAIVALALIAAATDGSVVAMELNQRGATMMTGIALLLAATGQVRRPKPGDALWRQIVTFWSGGTLLLTFALAARFGAATTLPGAAIGLAVAIALSRAAHATGWKLLALARVAALALAIVGTVTALGALRPI